jgi:hypothetical protein
MFFKITLDRGGNRDYKELSALALARAQDQAGAVGATAAPHVLLLGVTLFVILTALIYPNPVLTIATDALISALI